MNNNQIMQSIAILLIVCIVSTCMMTSVSTTSNTETDDITASVSLDDLGISETELEIVLEELRFSVIYLTTDENGSLKAEITERGRLGVDTTYDGLRIYLDTLSISAIMGGGATVVGAIIGSYIPIVGTLFGAALFGGIASYVSTAITEGLNWDNGIVVEVKLMDHHIIFGIDIPMPTTPIITNVSSQ